MKEIKENKYLIFDVAKKPNLVTLAKYLLNLFQRFWYGFLILNINKPKKQNKDYKYNVSICAIFKDEADYLKEWIEYHLIVGIDHFYLYNNESSDDCLEILRSYVEKGVVTLINWPGKQVQMQAYQNWADNYKDESKWVGFIDLDEFVVPNDYDCVYDFLKQFDYKRPVVIIYWRYFGTSGLDKRDIKGLVSEDFTMAWPKYADIGKFFFNTKYDYQQKFKRNQKMHKMWGKLNGLMLPPVNVFDKVCTCGFNSVKSEHMPIQINHYLLKSKEEYINRKTKKGGGVNPLGIHDKEYFEYHESFCTKKDLNINRFLGRLKKVMEG